MGLSDADIGLGAPAQGLSDADIGLAPQGVLSNSADDGYLSSAAKAIPTALRNAGNMIAGRFGDTANFGDYLAARLTSAVTGRSMDEVRDRTAKAQAAGSAQSPLGWAGAHLTGQKLVPSSQTFADLENPYTGEYVPTSEGGRMAMTGAEMALSGPGGAAGKVATVPGAVQRAFTRAGTLGEQVAARQAMAPGMALSGAASQYTTDVTGSPIAGIIAGAAIPAAGAKVVDAGKSLLATSSKRPGMVADKLIGAAENPDKFRADLNANPDEIIPGAKLTTGQQTGDLGILNAERQARTRDEDFGQKFKHREEQQNIAHGEALDAQAPEAADKLAPSALFQQHLDELDQQTQQTVDRMTAGRDQLHDQIPEAQPPEQVGANIRDPLQTARNASSQIQDELYRRVDPDGTFHVSTDPLHQGAAQIRAGVDPLNAPLSADEVRIHGQIADHAADPTVPFNSVRALEQNINEALRNAEPGSRAEGRLQQLKTIVRSARDEAIDTRHEAEQSAVQQGTLDPEQTMEARLRAQWGVNNVVNGRAAQGAGQGSGVLPRGTPSANAGAVGAEDAAVGRLPAPAGDSGVPQNPAAPQTTTEPADRLNVANTSYAAHKQTYGTGATGQILARKNQVGYTTSDAGVPAKAFAKGDKGYEAVRSVVEASNNHPQVIQGLQDAAVNRLQAEMAKNNGQLTPKMLAKWKADHAQALRGIDEVAPGFSRQFDNAAAAQDLVDRATAGREAALKAYNRSEAGKLVGKTSEQEVENHLGNILGDGGKGASRMQELVTAARGNLAALDGLKRATVDWLLRKKANNAEVGTSGAKSLSSAGVQGLVKNSEAQLRTLFGDAGYANLQKVAQSMAAKDRSTTATNIAGSPNTARDLGHLLDKAGGGNHETALALIASHVMEHGVSVAHLANAAMLGVPAMVISKMRAKGIHSVEEMYKDALLNPERARFYLSQAGSKTSPVWHSLARSLGAAPTQANVNDHNRDPSTNGPHVAHFAEGGLVSINNWHGALPPEAGGPPRKKSAPPPPLPPVSDLATITPDQILASIHANPHGPVAPAASSIDELLQRDGISAPQSKPRWYVAPDQRLSTNIENREGDGYFNPIAPPPTSFFGVPRNGTPPIMGKPGNWNQILPDRFTPMQGPIDHYAEGGAVDLPAGEGFVPSPENSQSIADYLGRKVSGIARGIYDAASAPGDAYYGKLDPNSEEGFARIQGLAGLATLGAAPTAGGTVNMGARLPKRGDASRMTELPNLRRMPVDEAVAIASRDPHLIEAGDQSAGAFVGGPRAIQSKRALTNTRQAFDDYVAADPRGADWYDRYRNDMNEVTGGDPLKNKWMSNAEGMFSAGVAPEHEVNYAIKEINGQVAGMPVKAARPAQFKAFNRAVDAQDPNLFQLGDKTGEYAMRINPDNAGALGSTATGVNDFRHARNFRYTEKGGKGQRDALGDAQHTFLDYETAAAVGRANDKALGGRTDWTGEKLQAAPWVRQKSLDFAKRLKMPYEEAFDRYGNRTIGDYFDKHTAFATHEAVPGASTGHLPDFVNAPDEVRAAYSADPRSSWANAAGGRDAIYSGMQIPGTGVAPMTRPTNQMQGYYTRGDGVTETNPGWTARPLVSFTNGKGGTKSLPPADRAILDAGEASRAFFDAQDAGAYHKVYTGGRAGDNNGIFMPMDRRATPEELRRVQDAGRPHGLVDITDTGQGLTSTSYVTPPPAPSTGALQQVLDASPGGVGQRVKVDPGYIDYTDKWDQGVGSGAATRHMLEYINKTPRLREVMNNNEGISRNALARMHRDNEYAAQLGPVRPDIQNARAITGQGRGWVDRLEKTLAEGKIPLPAIAGGTVGLGALSQMYGANRAEPQ